MGWTTGYTRDDGTARDIITRVYQGDPTSCAACGWTEPHHPRVTGSEYDAIYGPSKDPRPDPHDFRPFVPRYRVLDVAIVALSEAYLAVETIDTGEVWAGVALVRFDRDGTFGYKDMTETMGPGVNRCPARILGRLTPTTDDYANEWRASCRARLDRPKVKSGDRVTFASPLTFTNGDELATFSYVKGSTFRPVHDSPYGPSIGTARYTISNWRDRPHTIAAA